MTQPYPILDTSGKIRTWLEEDGVIRVWESHDLGAGRPDLITRANHTSQDDISSPHWAYPVTASQILTSSDVIFYAPFRIALKADLPPVAQQRVSGSIMRVISWLDSPSGSHACERIFADCASYVRSTPAGDYHSIYTIERYTLRADVTLSNVRRTDGDKWHGSHPSLHLHAEDRIGIMVWTAIIPVHHEKEDLQS